MDLIRGCLLIAKVGGARPKRQGTYDKYVTVPISMLAGNYLKVSELHQFLNNRKLKCMPLPRISE